MNRFVLSASGLILVAALAGCFDQGQTPDHRPATMDATKTDAHPFDARLMEIAGTYETYGRLDTSYRWAPTLCRPITPPPSPYFSASKDEGTHGHKLYTLFVQEQFVRELPDEEFSWGYIPASGPNPVGQVIVKEAWVPEEVKDDVNAMKSVSRTVNVRDRQSGQLVERAEYFVPYVRENGHIYHAAKKAGLFIMYKTDLKTPETDEGWVYGTVTADGAHVTSAGRVESCMACHREAPHDRLFGLRQE